MNQISNVKRPNFEIKDLDLVPTFDGNARYMDITDTLIA